MMGFEPTASRTTIWRSNKLSYTHQAFLILCGNPKIVLESKIRAIKLTIIMKMYLKGFEPPTHGLEGRCSILLSYRYM